MRIRTVALCCALLLALLLCVGAQAEWAEGQSVSGFTVTDRRTFDAMGAEVVTLEHDATGAQVMLILNEDTNRAFQIGFHTVAEDDTGLPHIMEHSVLCGSEKYPADLFFNVNYQTYNIYMNASTGEKITYYPLSSLSEVQLLSYADYYLDAVFHPLLTEETFHQEGWRYTLSSEDGELGITGTVYNEMRSALDLDRAAYLNNLRLLFPGSNCGNEYGGDPEAIPTLTYENYLDFHERYYHPSNSLTVLYGDIEDPEPFLNLLDGVFSEYTRRDCTDLFADEGYTPLEESVTQVYSYPVESSVDTEDASKIYYSFLCRGADEETIQQLDLFTTLVNHGSSVFSVKMQEELPNASCSCYLNFDCPEPIIYFIADGVNPEDAETFRRIVDESLADIGANGFDAGLTDAVISSYRLSNGLISESSSAGLNLACDVSSYYVSTGNLYSYFDYIESVDSYEEWTEQGAMEALVERFFADGAITALSVTRPVAGLSEERDAAQAAALAEVKAGMTDEEIADIVYQTNGGSDTSEEVDTDAYVRELTAFTVQELPEEIRLYDTTDETDEEGVRWMYAEAEADGIGICGVHLCADGLDNEQLHYAQLYLALLGNLDTSAHSYEELPTLMDRYLPGLSGGISLTERGDGTDSILLGLSFYGLDEDMDAGYDLLYELLFETDLTCVEDIADEVGYQLTQLKSSLSTYGTDLVVTTVVGRYRPAVALELELGYLNHYEFLLEVEALLEEDPQVVVDQLLAVRDFFLGGKAGTHLLYSGAEQGHDKNTAAAAGFVSRLGDRPRQQRVDEISAGTGSIGYILDMSSNSSCIGASLEELGISEFTADLEALGLLVTDRYLLPILRDQRGAYGASCGFGELGMRIYTHSDPCVAETYATCEQIGEMLLQDTGITQEIMDGYIMRYYSTYALSDGALTGGYGVLTDLIDGKTQQDTLRHMRELKTFTVDRLEEYADIFVRLADTNDRITAGYTASVTENADLFDTVVEPFAAK